MTADDLAAHAARVDADRYVENPVLTPVIADLLAADTPSRILFLHGPGGLGKSTALRAVARQGAAGYAVRRLDGRDLGPDVLPETLLPETSDPVLLVVDEVDALGAALHRLGRLLARLPASGRVLVGGRRAPVHGWVPDELDPVTRVVRMPPLPAPQAAELLRRHGVGEQRIAGLVSGAQGSPLALVMAAESDLAPALTPPARSEELIRRLAGPALHGMDQEVLHVAALTTAVDAELLADLLPGRELGAAYAQLREQTFVETRGGRAQLHPLLAAAVRDWFTDEAPARHRTLTLRLASALRDRALAGRAGALAELASLVTDPELRRGLGSGGADRYYAAPVRESDQQRVRDVLDPLLSSDPATAEALASTVAAGFAVRTVGGECAAVATVLPASTTLDGPFVAPLADYAREHAIAGSCVLTPLQVTLSSRELDPDLEAFRNAVALRRCGLANPRYDLVNELGWSPGEAEVMRRFGYEEVPALRRELAGVEVRTWLADSGPGGLVGLVHRAVLVEHGLDPAEPVDRGSELVDALEHFHSDAVMAGLDLAPRGHPTPDAADAARGTVRRAVARALAEHPDLLDLVEKRYYTAGATHEDVIRSSFLSRRSYFRRLSQIRTLLQEGE